MKKASLICCAILFVLISLIITLYPIISTSYNERHQSEILTHYEENLAQIDTLKIASALEAAKIYNTSLTTGLQPFSKEMLAGASQNYTELLNVIGNGIMGYVQIPKIDVNLPIYHGTDTATLDMGIGHLLGTSLPVGGLNTHSVLTAHSGMASQRLFSDLPQMEIGDIFYLEILDQVLAYQVAKINTVLPHDTSLLRIQENEDLCTLITCTPFGVNTHRLLVCGERIPYEEAEVIEQMQVKDNTRFTSSTWMCEYMKGILLGVSGAFLVLIIPLTIRIRRRCKRERN